MMNLTSSSKWNCRKNQFNLLLAYYRQTFLIVIKLDFQFGYFYNLQKHANFFSRGFLVSFCLTYKITYYLISWIMLFFKIRIWYVVLNFVLLNFLLTIEVFSFLYYHLFFTMESENCKVLRGGQRRMPNGKYYL
jgi:hypothetical protein